jgi:hypothetical protein
VVEIFSVTFFMVRDVAIEIVETKVEVKDVVTVVTESVGAIVDVTVTVCGASITEKGCIFKAVKSIHVVLEKKLSSRKVVASKSVI